MKMSACPVKVANHVKQSTANWIWKQLTCNCKAVHIKASRLKTIKWKKIRFVGLKTQKDSKINYYLLIDLTL